MADLAEGVAGVPAASLRLAEHLLADIPSRFNLFDVRRRPRVDKLARLSQQAFLNVEVVPGDARGQVEHVDLAKQVVGAATRVIDRVMSLVEVLERLARQASALLTCNLGLRSEEHTSELQSRQYLVCR